MTGGKGRHETPSRPTARPQGDADTRLDRFENALDTNTKHLQILRTAIGDIGHQFNELETRLHRMESAGLTTLANKIDAAAHEMDELRARLRRHEVHQPEPDRSASDINSTTIHKLAETLICRLECGERLRANMNYRLCNVLGAKVAPEREQPPPDTSRTTAKPTPRTVYPKSLGKESARRKRREPLMHPYDPNTYRKVDKKLATSGSSRVPLISKHLHAGRSQTLSPTGEVSDGEDIGPAGSENSSGSKFTSDDMEECEDDARKDISETPEETTPVPFNSKDIRESGVYIPAERRSTRKAKPPPMYAPMVPWREANKIVMMLRPEVLDRDK